MTNTHDRYELVLPPGLLKTVAAILNQHSGRQSAIVGEELTSLAQVSHPGIDQRQVREAIHELRRQGMLICAFPGSGGGYYVCQTLAEYKDFRMSEYHAKIVDMSITMSAMDKAAKAQFGDSFQPVLL